MSALVIVGAGSYETLLHMLIPLILIVYSAVLLSVVILRFKKPDLHRPYRVIFGKVGPFATILFMIFLLIMFIKETHGALDILRISGGLIVFGVPAYFAIELFYDKKYVGLRRNMSAKLSHYFHRIPLPKPSFNKIINLVGPFTKKSTIMVYNSQMGAFTQKIVKAKMPFRKIIVANQSKEEIKFFKENISLKDRKHITIHFLRSLSIPTKSGKVDSFISFNDLGYVKDISSFVHDVKKVLNTKGKFCFYIKNNVLNMTPNAIEVDDKKKILAIFKKEKLNVTYSRRRRLFKTEIFIYGKKKGK